MSPIESTPTPDDTTPRDGTPAAGNIGAAPQIRFLVRPTSPSGASARRRRSFAFPPAQPLGITAAFRHTILATLAILTTIAQPALAQIPPEVIHSEDFQSYPTQASPAGWVDTAVGQPGPAAEGIFKTWPDPTQGNRGTNIVYGTKQASGKPEGKTPRIGTFTTLTTKSFDGRGRFELRGRLIRTAADARAGITFFSSYPETDRYYLLGLWSQPGSSKLTMQLFGFRGRAEDGTPLGSFEEESIIDSNVTPEPGKWYRFLIQSDVIGETTHIRARFWLDGEAEPETFSIDAADSSPSRLTAGRIGVWAAVRGESYADELFAKSPVDFTAPVIEFFEGESPLPTGKKFNRNVAPLIRVTDDIDASPARTIELDGEPFTEGSTVESEGLHTIRVRAIDSAGNASDGQVTFLIDKTPPVVRIVVAGAPLTTGAVFDRDITPFVEVEDLTSTTIVATLGGEPYDIAHAADPGTPITAEALHTLLVTVTDELGWTTTAGPVSFAVDKTAPVIRILEGGSPFGAGSYNRDLTLVIEVDDLTPQSAAFTLNGAPFVSGTPITAEQKHTFAGEARDRAGHVTTLDPIIFFIDKTKPLVEIFDGAKRLLDDSYVDHDVLPEVRISDESETTTTAALNGEPYDLATPITGEREHHLEVRVVDTVGWIVDLDVHFTIDKTPPSLALEVGGAPLVSGRIFSADLAVEAVSSDVNPEPLEALLNGTPYALGSAIEDERNHTIVVTAKDKAGNTTTAGPIAFVLDKSAPEVRLLLENGSPFPDGAHFNRDLQPQLEVADLTATTVVATITSNGNEQPWTPGTPITAEGSYTIAATVTDAAGHETVITPAGFVIDKTPPAITITSHADSAAIATPLIALRGGSDDAKTVLLNGVAATIDAATKTFISKDLNLLEGANRFDLLATDRAGNQTAKTLTLILDTRAPELAIAAPLANACSNSGSIALSGTVSDPRLDRVTVSIGAPGGAPEASVTATVAGSAWTATLPTGAEGPKSIVVEAADSVGHLARQQIAIRIDRTAPQIEVTEGGAPFAANRAVGRAIALFVRVTDADPSVAMQARLDGQPYTPGTQISAEGAHTLVVEAADCAGNAAAPLTLPFRIDLTAPALHAIDPANGSTIRTAVSSISGTTDDDVATVAISGGPQTTPAANGTFTLSGITLAEGLNRFRIELTDRAGNRTEVPYEVRLKSQPPSLEILESGTPIPPDAIFNREIRPEVRTGEPGVTPAVTLNGGPFNSGSPVTADGAYTLAATATDSVGNTASSSVAFTIDRTPPVVTITSPASGPAEVAAIDVAGTAGDAIEVTVNGRLATLSGGNFSVTALPLDEGENAIVAAGRDAAGNFGRDEVVVTREAAGPGIILTHPAGGLLTNRPFTRVAGRVLTAAKAAGVSVERRTASGESVESTLALDPAGAFVLDALPLVEGENVITVSTIPSPLVSGPSSLSITVTADLTPPTLAILEAALPLAEGARFPERAILSIDASDTRLSPLASRLFVDGSEVTTPHTVSSAGGHTAIALARDDAGNETRLERNFYIGLAGTATAGCDLREIDPRDGSVITNLSTTLVGRSGGAARVKVNGVDAVVAGGSFWATVELGQEGENAVVIQCLDESGRIFGDSVTLTLIRVTSDPSIGITAPDEGAVTESSTIAVTGTIGPGVAAVDVNGAAAVIEGSDPSRTFRAGDVRLAAGLNLVVARARNAAERSATASRRIVHLEAAPQIAITAPTSPHQTGAASIRVSGTWSDLDPETLTISASFVSKASARISDTHGTFEFRGVALAPGEQTLAVTGRNAANRTSTAMLTATHTGGSAHVAITEPLDNSHLPASAPASITVRGAFTASAGAIVDVNGVPATLDGATFTASVPLLDGTPTPIVARLTEPSGAVAIDLVRVTRLTAPLTVRSIFPDADAVDVSAGVMVLAGFSAPLDRDSVVAGFRLEAPSGSPVSGQILVDREVVSFAPAAALASGARYTIRFGTAIRDAGGNALAQEVTRAFTVAFAAAAAAPSLDPIASPLCATELTVAGSARPGGRVRLDAGGLTLTTLADAAGRFSFRLPLAGQSGFHLVRVRAVGSDGGLSPAAELRLTIDCSGPIVTAATYDRTTNALSITFSKPIAPSTLVVAPGGSVQLLLSDGRTIGGTIAAQSPSSYLLTPSEDLRQQSFTLVLTNAVHDTTGRPLSPFTASFSLGSTDELPGEGPSFISGEVYDATTGRPLAGAMVRIDVPLEAFSVERLEAGGWRLVETERLEAGGDGEAGGWRLEAGGGDGETGVGEAGGWRLGRRETTAASIRSFWSEERSNELFELSRSSGMAEGDGNRTQRIRINARVPEGRAVWTDRTSQEGGSFGSLEHSRGPWPRLDKGLSSTLVDRDGLDRGTGNTTHPFATTRLSHREASGSSTGELRRAGENAARSSKVTSETSHSLTSSLQPPASSPARPASRPASSLQPLASPPASSLQPPASSPARPASSLQPLASMTLVTDQRGRYATRIPEGAHTIEVSAFGYTSAWRQIIIPSGAGVVPIDIRLTAQGSTVEVQEGEATLATHGGDTQLTAAARLEVPAGGLPSGTTVTLTAVGAQSLAGLLPLGWSPIASAEVVVDGSATPAAASLSFTIPSQAIVAAAQTLTAVQYDSSRDGWIAIQPVVTISGDQASFSISSSSLQPPASSLSSGAYALVYPDKAPNLATPPSPRTGAPLTGVTDPCITDACGPFVSKSFTLEPPIVLPTGRTTATLVIEGSSLQPPASSLFPSGTAVQSYIDEELTLADGSTLVDPPFATDLLLYRSLDGTELVADFHLAPSAKAAEVALSIGYNHIRILPYPGRLDRGTIVGPEGGRVPADGGIAIEIPTGATSEPLRATAASITDLGGFGVIEGFRIVAGFTLSLERASAGAPQDLDGDGQPDALAPVELLKSARATFVADPSQLPAVTPSQLIVAEVLDATPFGRHFRLATLTSRLDSATSSSVRYTSLQPPASSLSLDGIIREGRYLLLAAEQPIAFATGSVRLGTRYLPDVQITTPASSLQPPASLGVTDLTRLTGLFALPVLAQPAAPFALTPRSATLGAGATYTHTASPAPDAIVNVGDLLFVAQPPRVAGTVPAKGATEVPLTQTVQVSFVPAIDPASAIDGSIAVVDAETGVAIAGALSANTSTITWSQSVPGSLAPNARYAVTVSPAIRGANGALLGQAHVFSFSTITRLTSTEVVASKIHITIPDENGQSRIFGDPGAIPAGWNALAVRRGRSFITQYQAAAAGDGSFSFLAGTSAADRITISDSIDLNVINANGALAAIIPLTPFVSEDRRAFVALPDTETRHSTADGVTVIVPPGAFDQPTIVTATPEQQSAFAAVPNFAEELNFATAVTLTFDCSSPASSLQPPASSPATPCIAKQRLQLQLPIPAGLPTANRQFLLGWLGESIRGPRVMAVDTLRVANGKFTTEEVSAASPEQSTSLRATALSSATAIATVTDSEVKSHLLGAIYEGVYTAFDIKLPVGAAAVFGFLEGLKSNIDLFFEHLDSMYAGHTYIAERGGNIVIPIITNRPFELVGVDASTGLHAFSKVYDPIATPDPGTAVRLPSPEIDRQGPYPVFGTPFRVEILDVDAADVPITTLRNFIVQLSGDEIVVTTSATPLPEGTPVSLLNVSNGAFDPSRAGGLRVRGKIGDRIVLIVGQREVDPSTPISVVFSEPIFVGPSSADDDVDTFLRARVTLRRAASPALTGSDITSQARFRLDSNGRRLLVDLPAALQRGETYRLILSREITDRSGSATTPGLRIGEVINGETRSGGLSEDLQLELIVRAPGGHLTSFDIRQTESLQGSIRDLSLNGNVLFISALEAGLLAYDVVNPVALEGTPVPIGVAPSVAASTWAVASDHHGRVYTTIVGNLFGSIRTYRIEDFVRVAGEAAPRVVSQPTGAGIVSWAPGASTALGLSSDSLISDRPEAIPRKVQILIQDGEELFETREEFKNRFGPAVEHTYADGLQRLTVTIAGDRENPYRRQRITVENLTLDMRWSADATPDGSAELRRILAGPSDRIRVLRNERTYAVLTLFGYGVSVLDVNAIESNDEPTRPSDYRAIREQIRLTNAALDPDCPAHPPLESHAIPDLTFTPEAAILTQPGTSDIYVYSLETRRGVLDLAITPPGEDTIASPTARNCGERSPFGLVFRADMPFGFHDHPRLASFRASFKALTGKDPVGRFTGVAHHRWRLEAKDNAALRPVTSPTDPPPPGVRGSISGTSVTRDYLLIPGKDYGLLVVEVSGQPPSSPSGYRPLDDGHLVDVIWIPGGAYAVRAIARSQLATVVDGEGRVLLVDLSRLDERFDRRGIPRPLTELFPTVAHSLSVRGPYGVGIDDPRIVWKSEKGLVSGTLAPVVDPDSGMIYAGRLLEKGARVVAAIDPRVQMKTDLGAAAGLSEVGGVAPLGVDPPAEIQKIIDAAGESRRPDASLAAFRLEVTLPGGITEALAGSGGVVRVAVESERVAGAATEQTPAGLPRAHLRTARRDGSADPRATPSFVLQRIVPPDMAEELRHQKGFNKFISPWIVAIADPRASLEYDWGTGVTAEMKRAAGCASCDRPRHLAGGTEAQGVFELYSNGRILAVRPELAVAGTRYDYLAAEGRLTARFATTMADTVRTPEVLVAAHNAPVAGGMIQEAVYLHSGELETSAVDLDAGGSSGWNVVIDRTYRSRTIGGSPLGLGWESRIFQRLRPLPNGDVEYRDGMGEVWLFTSPEKRLTPTGLGTLVSFGSPPGLFLRLTRTDEGWILIDQQWRLTAFDSFGRLVSESDEFTKSGQLDAGNYVRYFYDETGRLAQIVDPVGRSTLLEYHAESELFAGTLKRIRDWRGRSVDYSYDAIGRLAMVALPELQGPAGAGGSFTGANRPKIEYGYANGTSFRDRLELASNLASIREPAEVAADGSARVAFAYEEGVGSPLRDRVVRETWGTGETASFSYRDDGGAGTVDALGFRRNVSITRNASGAHVAELELVGVPVLMRSDFDEAITPAKFGAPRNLTWKYEYLDEGPVQRIEHPNDLIETFTWEKAVGVGLKLGQRTESGPDFPAITTDILYERRGNAVNTPRAISRSDERTPAVFRETEQGSRDRLYLQARDLGVRTLTVLDPAGRAIERKTFASESDALAPEPEDGIDAPATRDELIAHHSDTDPILIARGQVASVKAGGGEVHTSARYEPLPMGSKKEITRDEKRATVMERVINSWDLPVSVVVKDSAGAILVNESFSYDAAGRLARHARSQRDPGEVVTTYEYDALSRVVKTTESGARAGETTATLVTTVDHNLAERKITTTGPHVAGSPGLKTITTLDGLGRVAESRQQDDAGAVTVSRRVAYDIQGQLAYETDGTRTASFTEHDVAGRPLRTLRTDRTRSEAGWNAWGEPLETAEYDADSNRVARSRYQYTNKGRLRSVRDEIEPGGQSRATIHTWDDGQTTTSVRLAPLATLGEALTGGIRSRAVEQEIDRAGRVVRRSIGGASGFIAKMSAADEIERAVPDQYLGNVAARQTVTDRSGASYVTSMEIDAVGRPTEILEGSGEDAYRTSAEYDEAGNVISAGPAGLPAETMIYDGRGLVLERRRADGTTIRYEYDALGSLTGYRDETNQTTIITRDGLGRVVRAAYPDGTHEETRYEPGTGLVVASLNRAGDWRSFVYDAASRVTEVRLGFEPATAPLFEKYTYDKAGRLTSLANRDAAVEFEDFDLLGRPRITRARRYSGGSGLSDTPVLLDVHTQGHEWPVFDERTRWRMPAAGEDLPPSEPDTAGTWFRWIDETRDEAGTLTLLQSRANRGDEAALTEVVRATVRGVGRIATRVRPAGASSLVTAFGFDDGRDGSPQGPGAGLLGSAITSRDGRDLAGSRIRRDSSRRVSGAVHAGTADRTSSWSYDGRGRLAIATLGMLPEGSRPLIEETLTAADFRERRSVSGRLTPAQRATIGASVFEIEPASWVAEESAGAHAIAQRTLTLPDLEAITRSYAFSGGRRVDDGLRSATYDEKDRLVQTEQGNRRVFFIYDPNDRLVGRRVEVRDGSESAWRLEDRTTAFARDGLPPAATFLWDPIADRLVAITDEGRSLAPGDEGADAGLVRQIVHGDQAWDDPVEIRALQPDGSVKRLLPIADEAAGGSVVAVAGGSGNLIERSLYADSYGDAPKYLHGPVVDEIAIEAARNGDGTISEVRLRIHLSEALVASSLAEGVRLVARAAASTPVDGAPVTESVLPFSPSLSGEHTILWTLTGEEWAEIADDLQSLRIEVTDRLRASAWAGAPPMRVPSWAELIYPVTGSPGVPLSYQASLDEITTFLDSLAPGASRHSRIVYSVPDLYLAASSESKARLLTGFKAAPFVEPSSGLVYLRDRWYDPSTGSWLTDDENGYVAGSSNLYAAFLNDPVNNADPDGREPITLTAAAIYLGWTALNTAIDTAIDYGFHQWLGEEGEEFDLLRSASTNFTINLATGGIGGKAAKLRYLKYLKNPAVRAAAAEGIEYAADVGLTGTVQMVAYDQSAAQAYGSAAFGGALGRTIRHGVRAVARHGIPGIDFRWGSRTAVQRGTWRIWPTRSSGYGVNDPPVRIPGKWTINDMKQGLLGHPPRSLRSPDLHHADQMPGSGIHEVLADLHRNNPNLHPNKFNQGVTPEIREQDRRLHWWYRAREEGADELLPDWIYDK